MKKYIVLLLLTRLISSELMAQTSIQLTRYPPYDFRVSGVFDINILNLSGVTQSGSLYAKITRKNDLQTVAEISSSVAVVLEPGMNSLSSASVPKSVSSYDMYAQTTDKLAFGDHEVCVTFTATGGTEPSATACILLESPLFTLPYLVYPHHESVIGSRAPNLIWSTPVITGNLEVRYKLDLVEVLQGQQAAEAVMNNFRILSTDFLGTNSLLYPSTAGELMYDRDYAWQVSTYINGALAGKTEVWTFRLAQDSFAMKKGSIPLNYIVINDLDLEGIYTARDHKLYVELNERFVQGEATFTVYEDAALKKSICMIREPRKTGLNLYTLNLASCGKKPLKNKVYYLAVKSNNKTYKLQFRIQQP